MINHTNPTHNRALEKHFRHQTDLESLMRNTLVSVRAEFNHGVQELLHRQTYIGVNVRYNFSERSYIGQYKVIKLPGAHGGIPVGEAVRVTLSAAEAGNLIEHVPEILESARAAVCLQQLIDTE